ncbi:MAG: SUMF1/EgtB/PvdO family nonheme iron enzyme [Planctomycetota bacterium]
MHKNTHPLASVILLASIGIAQAENPQRHAVIIGINDYADAAIPDLRYAELDARAVYDTLADPAVGRFPKGNLKLLLGVDASPSAIKAALYGLRGASKDDLVIIFYSGHGAKEGDEAYWVTQNAQAKALPATALSNTDIRKFIDMIPSERLIILLDCCYAASTIKKDLVNPGKLFGRFAGRGRVTIAGAAENQEALEYVDEKSGIFTHFLVAGLRGSADANTDGVVTFDELWRYLGDNVRKASVKQGGLHEPKIITEGGITPQFLLTFNPAVKMENEKAVSVLRKLFDEGKITGALYDEGHSALTKPALDPEAAARREIFNELVAGRLTPRFLKDVLDRRLGEVRKSAAPPPASSGRPTLAVVPFDVLGEVKAKDAGAILAERLLPHFADRYRLIDQTQLRHFLNQDDLTAAGLADAAPRTNTKSLSKAVKLRAVRYLVVGTVSGLPDGSLSVTARLCDWQTGGVEDGRIAQIGATDWSELVRRLPLLAARLSGSLTGVSPESEAPEVKPPEGVAKLITRCRELEGIAADLEHALKTLTARHPRIVGLTKRHREQAELLQREIKAKIAELWAADARLAEWYQADHPQRLALAEKLHSLMRLLKGQFWQPGSASPESLMLDLGRSVTMELVLVPASEFLMGSSLSPAEVANRYGADEERYQHERPQHCVRVTKPFYIGKTEVTQAQWRAVMGSNPAQFRGSGEMPVEMVSWDDCQEFCAKLSERTRRKIRLPTEAEWECACRAVTTTAYSFGDAANRLGEAAWYVSNSGGQPHAVAQKTSNAWGLYDMHGNVWEWCHDRHGPYPSGTQLDPIGPKSGAFRVLRGGAYINRSHDLRSAYRGKRRPDIQGRAGDGFRIAAGTTTLGEGVASSRTRQPVEPWTVVSTGTKSKTLTLDCGVSMELVLVPAGEFMMGSPGFSGRPVPGADQHWVRITKPFYMGKCEVTQGQWQVVMGTDVCQLRDKAHVEWPLRGEGRDYPMYYVSWEDAKGFCETLSQKVDWDIRLPTEAEWEYACRAGTQTRYSFGDDASLFDEYVWHEDNSNGRTHPVGRKKPNPWGLHDMHGNVQEWCADWADSDYYGQSPRADPPGPASARILVRVLRGGSWADSGELSLSSWARGSFWPRGRYHSWGFRVAAGT